jgi:hypothetical protein
MNRFLLVLFIIYAALAASPQGPPAQAPTTPGADRDVKLPNGKSQRDEIVKEDYKRNQEDAAQLLRLAEEVKSDIEKDEGHVVSVKTLKKVDDIEKLAKAIKGRLKRY